MRKFFALLIAVSMVTFLVACGGSDSSAKESGNDNATANATYTIKFANNGVSDPEYPQNKAMNYFKKIVEERSNGQITVEVYTAGTLGDTRTIMEGVQLGTIEMGDIENGIMSGFVPEACIWDLPYLFSSLDQAHEVLDGEIGQQIQGLYESIGVKNLAYNDGGFRYFTNSKRPVKNVDDLKGLKIRVMESNVMINSMNAFGASPVPMAFSELYTALQQGTVDGQENPLDLIYAQNFHEVQKYLSLSEHFYYPRQYVINLEFYKSLPEDLQQLISDAAIEACQYQREESAAYIGSMLEKLKERGFEVDEFDKTKAMKLAESVWPDFYEQIGSGDAVEGEKMVQAIAALR
ncbi:MAG: DctP family TRAP transporter solute-binding subunit [Lachnospiraceae bacterium]|nr:DctP family TRAP transporter solute-binding subunit [Lachnospiraceae bacterium]